MLTVSTFLSHLRSHDPNKPICFCRCPQALRVVRIKTRGEGLINIEFAEGPHRTDAGQLWIDDPFPGAIPTSEELRTEAMTVGEMLSGWGETGDWELTFGESEDGLKFVGIVDAGEWVSIEFEQRIFRGDDGRLVVEETRDGRPVRHVFPLYSEREFEAFKDEHNKPPGFN
jgi:hypothetical protein